MAYIFARTERNLERYCKIKDNNLSFQVGVFSSWWVGDFSIFWVDVLVFFELISWCFFEFLSWWVDKLTGWQVDLSCTSCVRRAFILCWHHSENKHLLFIETLKVKTTSITIPTSLLNPRSLTCQPVYLLTSWQLYIANTFIAHRPTVYSPLPFPCVGKAIGLTAHLFPMPSSFPLACARTIYNI